MAIVINLLMASFCLLVSTADQNRPTRLTESQLIEAIRQHPRTHQTRASLRVSAAQRRQLAAAFANPSLSLERQSVREGNEEVDESFLGIAWQWDKLGQRSAYRALADREQALAEADLAQQTLVLIRNARLQFAQLSFLQQEARSFSGIHDLLKQRLNELETLASDGELPQLDVQRVNLVLRRLEGEISENQTRQGLVWGEIAAWLPGQGTQIPQLQTTPSPPVAEPAQVSHPQEKKLDLTRMVAEDSARLMGKRWSEISLSAGLKRFETRNASDTGFAMAVSLPLPVRRPKGEARLQARLDAVVAKAEKQRFEEEKASRLKALAHELSRLKQAAARQSQWRAEAEALFSTTLFAYRQGEVSLDAVLGALDQIQATARNYLEQNHLSWLVRIEMDYWQGKGGQL